MSVFTQELLREAAIETLESAAFMLAEVRDGEWKSGEPVWRAEIRMTGLAQGRLVLASTAGFAAELAANLLGTEMDDSEVLRKREDALGEILNMICGVLLERLPDGGIGSSMETPSVERVPAGEHGTAMASAACSVMLSADDEPLDLAVFA